MTKTPNAPLFRSEASSIMGHTKTKTFFGIFFLLTWAVCLIGLKPLRDTLLSDPEHFHETVRVLLFYFNIPIFLVWLLLGLPAGLPVIAVTCVVTAVFFEIEITSFPMISFIVTGFLGYRMNRVFENDTKNLEIAVEKLDEELNLLSEKIKLLKNDNSRMRSSLKRITHLKEVIDGYSLTIHEGDVLDAITEHSFELFPDGNRILIYVLDTERQELMLARSKKRSGASQVKAKKGDIFDRWVLKRRIPLLVEDKTKDFRFSAKEESNGLFNSLISAPLVSENNVTGILRIDSPEKNKFTQSDLRFLDIIADLSAVSLENAMLYKKVQDLAIHDSLTGLYVHKYFVERLKDEIKRSLRSNMPVSLLMLDIDDFKAYNDRYGHNAGDLALRHVAAIIKSFARPGDIISRYGGEEFSALLLNKDKEAALEVAERIREKVNMTPLVLRREETRITVSLGVASSPAEEKMADELIRLADSRLYTAKEKGKNMVWAG